jgi:hypothetical protein
MDPDPERWYILSQTLTGTLGTGISINQPV